MRWKNDETYTTSGQNVQRRLTGVPSYVNFVALKLETHISKNLVKFLNENNYFAENKHKYPFQYYSRHKTPRDTYKQVTVDGQTVTITNATIETWSFHLPVSIISGILFSISPFSKQLTAKNLQISIFTAGTFVMYSERICTNIDVGYILILLILEQKYS